MALSSEGFPKPGWAAAAQGERGVGEDCGCDSGGGVLDGEPVWILRVPRETDVGALAGGMPFREDASWQKMHSCVDEERCEGGICGCQCAV
jgi:hypothetical protein